MTQATLFPRLAAALMCLGLAVTAPAEASGQAAPYRVSVGDTLSVSLPGEEAATQYLVDADGAIAIDGVSRVAVAGRSFAEIENTIRQEAVRVGAFVAPSVTVGIVEYAPILAIGAVRTPGEIPFRPGMTVLDAVGLAGGLAVLGLDPDVAALQQLGLEAELQTSRDEVERLKAREKELRQRLDLDLALRSTVSADRPARAGDGSGRAARGTGETPTGQGPAARAQIALAAIAESAPNGQIATEVETAAELLDLWEQAIAENDRQSELLRQRVAAQERILALNREEFERNQDLVERGILAPNSLPQFARQLTASEATLLEIESALSTVRNRIVDLEEERSRFLGQRRSQLLSTLADLEDEIEGLEARRRSIRYRLAAIAGLTLEDDAPVIGYELRRAGRSARVPPGTPLRPNDVINITLAPTPG
ncbi:MAG: polysaccharide biosynthesis/export family protein [Pseudomonadota bacterium]